MENDWVTITVPMSEHAIGTTFFVSGVVLLSVLIFFMSRREHETDLPTRLIKKLGLGALHPVIFVCLSTLWLLLFVSFAFGVFWVLFGIAQRVHVANAGEAVDLRWYLLTLAAVMAALGAVVTLPFTMVRLELTRQQTKTAVDQLFNDKMSSATADLAARRQVTREVKHRKEKKILTEWQDDLLTRAGAIDRLEGLAQERPTEAPRIARALGRFIQELSREDSPEVGPETENPRELELWASQLKPKRTSVESAIRNTLQTIERLNDLLGTNEEQPDSQTSTDLSRSNLQGFFLSELRFSNAQFNNSYMQGTDLARATIQKADFSGAQLLGADLRGANLFETNLRDANFESATLAGADLRKSSCVDVNFSLARLASCKLQNANLTNAIFLEADLLDAQLDFANLTDTDFREAELNSAKFRQAYFCRTKFDEDPLFYNNDFDGAAVQHMDFSKLKEFENHLSIMFGDGSVILPGGGGPNHSSWPAHWPKSKLSYDQFRKEWQKWRADPESYVPPERRSA